MAQLKTTTLGELRSKLAWLKDEPDNTLITFGNGDLTFDRAEGRGDMINIEFNELYKVTADPDDA